MFTWAFILCSILHIRASIHLNGLAPVPPGHLGLTNANTFPPTYRANAQANAPSTQPHRRVEGAARDVDQPSNLFASYGNPDITEVGKYLDQLLDVASEVPDLSCFGHPDVVGGRLEELLDEVPVECEAPYDLGAAALQHPVTNARISSAPKVAKEALNATPAPAFCSARIGPAM
jgi:hypothetical protein